MDTQNDPYWLPSLGGGVGQAAVFTRAASTNFSSSRMGYLTAFPNLQYEGPIRRKRQSLRVATERPRNSAAANSSQCFGCF